MGEYVPGAVGAAASGDAAVAIARGAGAMLALRPMATAVVARRVTDGDADGAVGACAAAAVVAGGGGGG